MKDLVYIEEHGLRGHNFYVANARRYGITHEELVSIEIKDSRVMVSKKIIPALLAVNEGLKKSNFELLVKDGYRSKELYQLAYRKRKEKYQNDTPDKLMNMTEMPHSSGLSVDVGLFDPISNQEILTRRREDGPESLLFDFYRNKNDKESQRFQKLQDLIKETMIKHDFEKGRLNEYFHFNFKKNS